MNIRLSESPLLLGTFATIYNVIIDDGETLFDRFVAENIAESEVEVLDIFNSLRAIGHKTGGRVSFFKENEGKLGDGVCAMFDQPDYKLRLYCIKYGKEIIILGGGSVKDVRTWQDDPKLNAEASLIIKIAREINQAITEKDIKYSNDYMKFEGDLTFEID